MITLKSTSANYGINIPSDPKEIDKEVLSQLLSNITVPKFYCVVALRYRVSLFELAMQGRNKSKKSLVSVVPIMAKFNKEDIEFNVSVGDRVILEGSSIERATHLSVNTAITPDSIVNYILSDEELNKKSINRSLTDGKDDTIFCLEFKIVPVNALRGKVFGDIIDPFIVKN